ncbi:lipocalin-like domain-containing protein [Lysobacter fragariae]
MQVCLVSATVVAGLASGDVRADSVPVVIPRDEAPHDVTLEWWYYTGFLSGRDIFGKMHNYGYQVTYFRIGQQGTFPLASIYIGNMAITDLTRGTHTNDSRLSVQPDVLLPGGGYNIQLQDWNMQARNGTGSWNGGFLSLDYSLALNMQATTPVILNGDGGIMPPNATGALNYYSFVNVQAAGTIIDHGLPIAVTGTGWFDHEYGTPGSTPVGWHWYGIELDDGAKYNVSVLKNALDQTTLTYGTYIKADGSYSQINPVELDDSATLPLWTSPRTGVSYPTGSTVRVPGGQLTLTGLVKDQEMTLLGPNLAPLAPVTAVFGVPNPSYWEGAAKVTGIVNGRQVTGKAYMEFKPYAAL